MTSFKQEKNTLGRPLSFSKHDLTNAITELFWTYGYAGLSLKSISEHTGIKRSSLYNTFETKEALMFECLQHYASQSPLKAVDEFDFSKPQKIGDLLYTMFAKICALRAADKKNRGCFAANMLHELIGTDTEIGQKLRHRNTTRRQTLTALIKLAVSQNELPQDTDAETSAYIILSFLSGLNVFAKQGTGKKELLKMSETLLAKLGFIAPNPD